MNSAALFFFVGWAIVYADEGTYTFVGQIDLRVDLIVAPLTRLVQLLAETPMAPGATRAVRGRSQRGSARMFSTERPRDPVPIDNLRP